MLLFTFLMWVLWVLAVAQSLSARPDIIGTETAKVLAELQDRLPPFPSDEAVAIIEEEFGCSLRNIFAYLSMEPVAAASFGQVGDDKGMPY
jgi:aarF domain-containing kinase